MSIGFETDIGSLLTGPQEEGIRKANALTGYLAGVVEPNNTSPMDRNGREHHNYLSIFRVNYPEGAYQTEAHDVFRSVLGLPEIELIDEIIPVSKSDEGTITRQVVTIEDMPGAAYVCYMASRVKLSLVD